LENLQDPGNVGTILRTAAAAGVDQVWLTSGCADVWSPKVLRAGMGAHFHLALRDRIDISVALQAFDGPLCITTLDDATSLYQTDLRGNMVLALGSEGSGISSAHYWPSRYPPHSHPHGHRHRVPQCCGSRCYLPVRTPPSDIGLKPRPERPKSCFPKTKRPDIVRPFHLAQ
jgi:tRNA(Leu) C34 or U34 (ribose-2'-O)-methylase TrmL